MSSYREIVTKAIVGKCKKSSRGDFEITPEQKPDTILGCWIINHSFSAQNSSGKTSISGSFDVNVWYSYDNNSKTAVSTKNLSYSDLVNVPLKSGVNVNNKTEIFVECLKQPSVLDVKIDGDTVKLKVEKEMGIEVIGNTTVKIAVEDTMDDYEEVDDTFDEKELNINLDELNDDYLQDAVNK